MFGRIVQHKFASIQLSRILYQSVVNKIVYRPLSEVNSVYSFCIFQVNFTLDTFFLTVQIARPVAAWQDNGAEF